MRTSHGLRRNARESWLPMPLRFHSVLPLDLFPLYTRELLPSRNVNLCDSDPDSRSVQIARYPQDNVGPHAGGLRVPAELEIDRVQFPMRI